MATTITLTDDDADEIASGHVTPELIARLVDSVIESRVHNADLSGMAPHFVYTGQPRVPLYNCATTGVPVADCCTCGDPDDGYVVHRYDGAPYYRVDDDGPYDDDRRDDATAYRNSFGRR